jgi:hypothetical protein
MEGLFIWLGLLILLKKSLGTGQFIWILGINIKVALSQVHKQVKVKSLQISLTHWI